MYSRALRAESFFKKQSISTPVHDAMVQKDAQTKTTTEPMSPLKRNQSSAARPRSSRTPLYPERIQSLSLTSLMGLRSSISTSAKTVYNWSTPQKLGKSKEKVTLMAKETFTRWRNDEWPMPRLRESTVREDKSGDKKVKKEIEPIKMENEMHEYDDEYFWGKDVNKKIYIEFRKKFKGMIIDEEGNLIFERNPGYLSIENDEHANELNLEKERQAMLDQRKELQELRKKVKNSLKKEKIIEKLDTNYENGQKQLKKIASEVANSLQPESEYFFRSDENRKVLAESRGDKLKGIKNHSMEMILKACKTMKDEELVVFTKKLIEENHLQNSEIIEKALGDNKYLKDQLNIVSDKHDLLLLENETLNHRMSHLKTKFATSQETNEKLVLEGAELDSFRKSYASFQLQFPEITLEKFIQKYEYLEDTSLKLLQKVSELEDDILRRESEIKRNFAMYEEKIQLQEKKLNEKERQVLYLEKILDERRDELKNTNSFQESYLNLSKIVTSLFVDWSSKIDIYFKNNGEAPQANIESPEEMLGIMKKMVNISTPQKLQNYLRRIICSAFLLQRKYFPDHVLEKFEPEKIYERVIKSFDSMQSTVMKLKAENILLRKKQGKLEIKNNQDNKDVKNTDDSFQLEAIKKKKRRQDLNSLVDMEFPDFGLKY